MSEMTNKRCPQDDNPMFGCELDYGGVKFIAGPSEVAGINAMMSAITTLAGVMVQGVVSDYEVKVAMGILSKVMPSEDRHMLCPALRVLGLVNGILCGDMKVGFNLKTSEFVVVEVPEGDIVPSMIEAPPPIPILIPPLAADGGGILG